jgi:hypothetical protein
MIDHILTFRFWQETKNKFMFERNKKSSRQTYKHYQTIFEQMMTMLILRSQRIIYV